MSNKKRMKSDNSFIARQTGKLSKKLCDHTDSSAVMQSIGSIGEKSTDSDSLAVSGLFCRKSSGIGQPSALKRFFAVSVEQSVICSWYRRFVSSLLLSPVNTVAVFFLAFGLYSGIALGFKKLYMTSGGAGMSDFFIPALTVLISVVLMFSRGSIASKLAGSRFFSFFLNNIFMFDSINEYESYEEKNDEKAAAGKKKIVRSAKTSLLIPAFFGIAAGIASLFMSFESVLIAIALLIGFAAVMYSPESGLSLILLVFPFAPEKLLMFCASVMIFSYIMKVLRGKRNISFGYADIMIMLAGLCFLIFCGSGYAFIALAVYAVGVNTVRTKQILHRCINAVSFGFIIAASFGLAELFIETIGAYIDKDRIVIHTVESFFENGSGFVIYAISAFPYFVSRARLYGSSRIPATFALLLLALVCYIDGIAASLPILIISLILYFVISTGRVFEGIIAIAASVFIMINFVPLDNTVGVLTERNIGVLLKNIGSAGELLVGKRGAADAIGNISGFSSVALSGGAVMLLIIAAALFILFCSVRYKIHEAPDKTPYALCVVPVIVIAAFSFRFNYLDSGLMIIASFSCAMARIGNCGKENGAADKYYNY